MIIFPAIDIINGTCVRLTKGEYDTAEKVAENPVDTARGFRESGAEWIHMVDLDGAKSGKPENRDVFINVAASSGLNVEVGGGIRDTETIDMYLNSGISRVILGSAAVKNRAFAEDAVRRYGTRIAIGIDARGGMVATEGWLDTTSVGYLELGRAMCETGVKYFIFTDIDKDGTLGGPNFEQTKKLHDVVSGYGANVIASCGVKSLDDIKILKNDNIYGVICGKSIYSGNLDLKEAITFG